MTAACCSQAPCALQEEKEALPALQGSSSSPRSSADRAVEAKGPSQGPWKRKEARLEDTAGGSDSYKFDRKQPVQETGAPTPTASSRATWVRASQHTCPGTVTYKQTMPPLCALPSSCKLRIVPVPSLLGKCWDEGSSGHPT